MTVNQFDTVAELVRPHIQKQNTNYREALAVDHRLAVCRFLATGDSFTTIAFNFRMGISTVGKIVSETCPVLWEVMKDKYMPPLTEDLWIKIAKQFYDTWQFPNCIGAIDGKHVVIQAPANSGSMYFNYKGTFSIVLMALVDAEYCFIAVDIGNYGSNSDGAIFRDSKLGKGLENGSLHVSNANTIPDAPEFGEIPFVVVGDPAFPLKPYLMRPYPGRNLENSEQIFNYRLSRARRVSENAFSILAQRWQVYQCRLNVNAELAMDIVKATCVLHNFLQKESTSSANNGEQSIENIGENRGGLTDIPASMISGNRNKKEAKRIREALKDYFCSEKGAIEWQG